MFDTRGGTTQYCGFRYQLCWHDNYKAQLDVPKIYQVDSKCIHRISSNNVIR